MRNVYYDYEINELLLPMKFYYYYKDFGNNDDALINWLLNYV